MAWKPKGHRADERIRPGQVGGLLGLQGRPILSRWTALWRGRVTVTIAGVGELSLDDLVDRTVAVTNWLAGVTG